MISYMISYSATFQMPFSVITSIIFSMEVSEVALNGAKRFAGITISEGYNANISIVAALWADSDGTRDAIFDSGPTHLSRSSRGGGV